MTSGQPPQPPSGGEQPEHGHRQPPPGGTPSYGQQAGGYGQPPQGQAPYGQYAQPQYGQPQYPHQQQYGAPYGQQPQAGQQPHGQPQAGQQPYAQPYGQQPYGQPYGGAPGFGAPSGAGSGFSVDLKKLKVADYVIAAGTALFFVLALFPWWSYGDNLFGYSLSGFDDGTVSTAFLFFLLTTVWTLLPAFLDLRLGFARGWITVGLAGLGFVLTFFAWVESLSVSFQVWPLLGMLTAAAILLFAILSLVPQLKQRPNVPARLAGAAQWANQPAPEFGQPGRYAGAQTPPTYGQPAPPPPPPPAPGAPGYPAGPAGPGHAGPGHAGPAAPGGPVAPGGSTASGEGAGTHDRPAGG